MNTRGTIAGLYPLTTYECTIHAVTLLDGPASDPITATTDPGMCTWIYIYVCVYVCTVYIYIYYIIGN